MTQKRIVLLVGTVVALVVTIVVWSLSFHLYYFPSASMEDTILAGDRVVVEQISVLLSHEPKNGELVVHRFPMDRSTVYMKRIVGTPGDHLRIVNKVLYRNGIAVSEPYVKHSSTFIESYRDNFPSATTSPIGPGADSMLQHDVKDGEVTVPAGNYFVMGDNRDDSSDSRYWGYILKSDVVGRPLFVYLSSAPDGKLRGERTFKVLR